MKNIDITKSFAESKYNEFLNEIENSIGNGETTGNELNALAKKMFSNKFKGVYTSDTIPSLNSGQYAIINLDDSKHSGTHWICVVRTINNILVYDSFGRKTIKILPELMDSGNGVITETENDAEQKVSEKNCGQRCLAALKVYHLYGKKALLFI